MGGDADTPVAAAGDWGNFEYPSAECGSFTPLKLTDGEFFNHESAVIVDLEEAVELESGDTLVVLSCLAGASGGTRSTEVMLFGPDGNELDYEKLPLGDTTVSTDGFGSIDYEVWAASDPRCCPSGTGSVTFAVVDNTIVVDPPEEQVPADE